MQARGLQVVLVAAALVALLHGLILKKLYPDYNVFQDRPGRAHDGRPHDPLGAQYAWSRDNSGPYREGFVPLELQYRRSRDNDLQEMFEFAASAPPPPVTRFDSPPSDWKRCAGPLELIAPSGELKEMETCHTGAEGASYSPVAIVNQYKDEGAMTGGLMNGISPYDDLPGFGGSMI